MSDNLRLAHVKIRGYLNESAYFAASNALNGNMVNQSVTNAGIEALGQLKTDEKKHKKGKSGYEGTEDDN